MSPGHPHSALFAEYTNLMAEEQSLWAVISRQLADVSDGDVGEHPSEVALQRWHAVRARRATLDRAIEALAQPRSSEWGALVGDLD